MPNAVPPHERRSTAIELVSFVAARSDPRDSTLEIRGDRRRTRALSLVEDLGSVHGGLLRCARRDTARFGILVEIDLHVHKSAANHVGIRSCSGQPEQNAHTAFRVTICLYRNTCRALGCARFRDAERVFAIDAAERVSHTIATPSSPQPSTGGTFSNAARRRLLR